MSAHPLDEIKSHIEDMKCREQEQVRLRDQAITKYETIMRERMELENFVDKLKKQLSESVTD